MKNQIWLVAEREISTRLRSKAFLISTGILLFFILASVVTGGILQKTGGFDSQGEPTKVAVTSGLELQLSPESFEIINATDRAQAEDIIMSGEARAAVVEGMVEPLNLTVLAVDDPPFDLINALTVSPSVELLAPLDANPFMAYLIGIGFGIVFMMSAVTFGTTIAQSVVEEKQTRIVEILLAAVPARALLAGKIIGNSILALGQVVIIIALASVGMIATGQNLLFGELSSSLIWFAILFATGFVLLATLYSSAAALVSRQEDIGSVTSPVMMLVMIPYVLVIIFNSSPGPLAIMSYVPFSAPVGMPMRLYLGTAQWWEPILSLAILLATTAIMILIGSRIYSNSVLRTGSRVSLKDALTKTKSDA